MATVIPVLFLAIAVQGRLYEDLMTATVVSLTPKRPQAPYWKSGLRLLWAWITSTVLTFVIAAILVAGVAGEIQAILALDWSRTIGDANGPAQAVALLAVVAGIGPVLMIEKHLRPIYRADWQRLRGRKATAAPADSAAAASASPEEESSADANEPDAAS